MSICCCFGYAHHSVHSSVPLFTHICLVSVVSSKAIACYESIPTSSIPTLHLHHLSRYLSSSSNVCALSPSIFFLIFSFLLSLSLSLSPSLSVYFSAEGNVYLELSCGLGVILFVMVTMFVIYHFFWLELLLFYRSNFGSDERATGKGFTWLCVWLALTVKCVCVRVCVCA